jgi:hypothetical protein
MNNDSFDESPTLSGLPLYRRGDYIDPLSDTTVSDVLDGHYPRISIQKSEITEQEVREHVERIINLETNSVPLQSRTRKVYVRLPDQHGIKKDLRARLISFFLKFAISYNFNNNFSLLKITNTSSR